MVWEIYLLRDGAPAALSKKTNDIVVMATNFYIFCSRRIFQDKQKWKFILLQSSTEQPLVVEI